MYSREERVLRTGQRRRVVLHTHTHTDIRQPTVDKGEVVLVQDKLFL